MIWADSGSANEGRSGTCLGSRPLLSQSLLADVKLSPSSSCLMKVSTVPSAVQGVVLYARCCPKLGYDVEDGQRQYIVVQQDAPLAKLISILLPHAPSVTLSLSLPRELVLSVSTAISLRNVAGFCISRNVLRPPEAITKPLYFTTFKVVHAVCMLKRIER